MEEEWRWVPGNEGRYQVSSLGRVRSFLFSKTGKLMKLLVASNGYARIAFQFKERWLVHRLVATVFIPNPLGLPSVNHKDGKKINNVVDNLEWASYSDNMRHSWNNLQTYQNRVAVAPRAEAQHHAKLTTPEVIAIRETYEKGGISHAELAKRYGVTKNNIGAIIRRRNWRHI